MRFEFEYALLARSCDVFETTYLSSLVSYDITCRSRKGSFFSTLLTVS